MALVTSRALRRAGAGAAPRCSFVCKPAQLARPGSACVARASSDDAPPTALSVDEAYAILGLKASSTFEDVVAAKNRLTDSVPGDDLERRMQVEAAYDTLFMQSMKKRLTGELEVSSTVRFADVPETRKATSSRKAKSAVQAPPAAKLPLGGVSVAPPAKANATQGALVFGGLAAWALAQALLESPEAQAGDVAGLQLALAGGYAFYSFKQLKGVAVPRAAGLSVACFLAGAVFGGLMENWLRVDIVPIGSFASPGVFVTECAIAALAAGSLFLL